MKHIKIFTKKKKQVIDITEDINKELCVNEGICLIFAKHTTCALTTADLDLGTDKDLLDLINEISPRLPYRHPHNPEHAPDHIFSSIIGPSIAIPFKDNKLLLGTWQRVVLIELDGPRERNIVLSIYSSFDSH